MASSYMNDGRRGSASGWWLLLAGPIIWVVYHFIGYFLIEAACKTGWLMGSLLGLPGVVVIEGVLTLAALGAIVFVAVRAFRRAGERGDYEPGEYGPEGGDHSRLFAQVAGWFNVILCLIILADGAAFLLLRPCG